VPFLAQFVRETVPAFTDTNDAVIMSGVTDHRLILAFETVKLTRYLHPRCTTTYATHLHDFCLACVLTFHFAINPVANLSLYRDVIVFTTESVKGEAIQQALLHYPHEMKLLQGVDDETPGERSPTHAPSLEVNVSEYMSPHNSPKEHDEGDDDMGVDEMKNDDEQEGGLKGTGQNDEGGDGGNFETEKDEGDEGSMGEDKANTDTEVFNPPGELIPSPNSKFVVVSFAKHALDIHSLLPPVMLLAALHNFLRSSNE
jgi:hypothetical protein